MAENQGEIQVERTSFWRRVFGSQQKLAHEDDGLTRPESPGSFFRPTHVRQTHANNEQLIRLGLRAVQEQLVSMGYERRTVFQMSEEQIMDLKQKHNIKV